MCRVRRPGTQKVPKRESSAVSLNEGNLQNVRGEDLLYVAARLPARYQFRRDKPKLNLNGPESFSSAPIVRRARS